MGELNNIPELRFPEYHEKLEKLMFSEVLRTVSRPIKMKNDKKYSLVTVKRRYEGVVSRGEYNGKEILVKSQFEIIENDFIISKRQIVHSACGLVPRELSGSIVSNEYSILNSKPNHNIIFFNYFCQRPKISHTFYLSSIGVHIEKMLFKLDDWFKWKFFYPKFEEQTKIANFLTTVDERINLLTQQKEKLEQYKKGVMQQIFSQQLRFEDDDGKAFPVWKEKRLGEIGKLFSGGTPTSSKKEYYDGTIPFIKSGEISSKKTVQFLTDLGLKSSSAKMVSEGDLLIAIYGATSGETAIAKISGAINQAVICIRGEFDNIFLLNWLKFNKQRIINTYLQGGQGNLSGEIIKSIQIDLPSFKEQQKIASFLSTIDKKIELVNQQIEQSKTWKKGLLQKMFM